MSSLEVGTQAPVGHPALGHVNLMVDTFIANVSPDDLRSIVRNLLATGPPGVGSAFVTAARSRLKQSSTEIRSDCSTCFWRHTRDESPVPTPQLFDVLTRARALYGAGLGITSLSLLSPVVRSTVGLAWDEGGDTACALATIDSDIGQAIQSCKEEIAGGYITDYASAREAVKTLRKAVEESFADVRMWGGDFPFERASASLECWQL